MPCSMHTIKKYEFELGASATMNKNYALCTYTMHSRVDLLGCTIWAKKLKKKRKGPLSDFYTTPVTQGCFC